MSTDLDKIAARLGSMRGKYANNEFISPALRHLLFEDAPVLIAEVRRLRKVEAAARAWVKTHDDEVLDMQDLDSVSTVDFAAISLDAFDALRAALEAP